MLLQLLQRLQSNHINSWRNIHDHRGHLGKCSPLNIYMYKDSIHLFESKFQGSYVKKIRFLFRLFYVTRYQMMEREK